MDQCQAYTVPHDTARLRLALQILQHDETVENLGQILRLDALARVGHRDPDGRRRFRHQADSDPAAFRRVFIGVGKQVVDDFFDRGIVADDLQRAGRQGQLLENPVFLGCGRIAFHDATDQVCHVETAVNRRIMTRIHLSEVHQFLDEALHPVRIVLDDLHVAGRTALQAAIVQQLFARSADQGKRRAELMGNVGEETELGLVGFVFVLLPKDLHLHFLLPLHAPADQQVDPPGHGCEQAGIEDIGPPGVPPGIADGDVQGRHPRAPALVAVGAAHFETVLPGTEVGIGHRGRFLLIDPIVLETHQPVGVLAIDIFDILHGRIADAEIILVVPEDDVIAVGDKTAGILYQRKGCKQDIRLESAFFQFQRIETVEPLHAPEQEGPVGCRQTG